MQQKVKKRKILYVITKATWGGAQRYVYDLATNLPKTKFDVAVVFGGTGELEHALKEKGVRVISIRKLKRDIGIISDLTVFFELIKIFLREKPDIIHLNSSKVGGLGALAGRIYNSLPKDSFLQATNYKLQARIIFTVHGWAFNEERTVLSKFFRQCGSWLTVILSHTTIAVSDYDRAQGERLLFLKHKIVKIHNGIEKIKFTAKNTARDFLLPNNHPTFLNKIFWIGTIAELHNNKGLSYAINAVKKLKEKMGAGKFILVIIGEGEERETLEKLIQKMNLEHEVFLVGKKEKASSLLRAFDIVLLPSIKEGLPYVILEAGMAQLPVVGSDVGGIPEIIQDMKSGILVKSKHKDEIVYALEFLFTNPQKRVEFGALLKERVASSFSLKKMVEATKMLYRT